MSEKEVFKAFEEVTTRNVRAAVDHSNETRRLQRELEIKVEHLEGTVRQYEARLAHLQSQITVLQAKLYAGGSV